MAPTRRPRRKAGPSSWQVVLIRLLFLLGLAALGVHGSGELFGEACRFTGDVDPFSKPLWVSQRCDIDLKLQSRGSTNGLPELELRHLSSLLM